MPVSVGRAMRTAAADTSDAVALLRAEHAVARLLASTSDLRDSYPDILSAIGDSLDWHVAAAWEADPSEPGTLRRVALWHAATIPATALEDLRLLDSMPAGHGLPGRVWESGVPAWIVDVTVDPDFPRVAAARAAGLHSAFCFPIETAAGIAGALEFLTPEPRMPDDHLLATMASLGRQIGQYIDRARATAAVTESEARTRAILEAALECIVTMDEHGRVVEFNPAAERTFGYSRDEVIGRDMGDLIVPPRLRDLHRRGLQRYLSTNTPVVLNRRIEITGMRSDGTEFPVELAITRIPVPGSPVFTGYIRDITERKQAEQELRASRARIVQATDEERRRLERNLHDGAQQRLVALSLSLRLVRTRMESDAGAAAELLDECVAELLGATSELRELARGIHPAILTDRGLGAALKAAAARAPIPVEVTSSVTERLPAQVEAAAYFVVAEALTNVARYAQASRAEVRVERGESTITVEVSDDGVGGAGARTGSGLRGLADRVATLDGTLAVVSPPGEGTIVKAVIPCG
jgi:PAS domain S-box-containing protein